MHMYNYYCTNKSQLLPRSYSLKDEFRNKYRVPLPILCYIFYLN